MIIINFIKCDIKKDVPEIVNIGFPGSYRFIYEYNEMLEKTQKIIEKIPH